MGAADAGSGATGAVSGGVRYVRGHQPVLPVLANFTHTHPACDECECAVVSYDTLARGKGDLVI